MSTQNVEYKLSLKDQFSSKIKTATTNTEKLNAAVGKTQSLFSGIGSAVGVGFGVAGVASFGRAIVDSLKNYEYFSASLRTLMHGDAQASKSLEGQLVNLAAKTPFSLVEIQDATKQLLAYGFAAGDVTKNINMLGDVASALKIPFQDIAYLYGTLKTQGRAYTKDINQFTGRGIPIIAQLAKQFNVTDEAVKKLVEDGKVGFPEIEKAFKSMTSEGGMFFNMMAEQSKTGGGQISNMGDNWEQLKVNIGKSQSGIIAGTVSFLGSLINHFKDYYAESNKLEASIKKAGVGSYGESLNLQEEKKFMRFQDALQQNYAGGETATKIQDDISKLSNLLTNQYVAFGKKEMGVSELKINAAIIKDRIDELKGKMKLLGMKAEEETPTAKPGASALETGGTNSTTVEARGAQNFNIDIKNLVETLNIQAATVKESAAQIREEIIKTLIGAVNDFQIMATK